jgi:hypothetical protein
MQGKNMITKENQPTEIGHWFQCGRKWTAMPDIGSETVVTFSKSWWLWWAGLQPSWRGNESNSLSRTVPAGAVDWSRTRKGGLNGFFIIILALGWWFLGAKNNDSRNISNCGHALDDVIWVLEQIVGSDESTGDSEAVKRTQDEGDLGSQGNAKK